MKDALNIYRRAIERRVWLESGHGTHGDGRLKEAIAAENAARRVLDTAIRKLTA